MGWKSSIPEMVPDRSQNHLFSFSFFLPQNFSANRYLHKNRSIIHQRFETCNDYIKPVIKKLFPLVHVQEMAIPLLCHKTSDYPIAKTGPDRGSFLRRSGFLHTILYRPIQIR